MARIFVFGSNLAGRHGAGAALDARIYHGAIYGQGIGPQGRAYAIPTKDENLNPLSLDRVRGYVKEFLAYAHAHPELEFYVTRVGCGYANNSPEDIAPMFEGAPANCQLPEGWRLYFSSSQVPEGL